MRGWFAQELGFGRVTRSLVPRADGPTGLPLFGLVLVGYLVGSELAFRLADAADLAAVLFIPAGITVGALLRASLRQWPLVLAAAAIGELVQDLRSGLALYESLGYVAANTIEPLLAAVVLRQLIGHVDLSFRRHTFAFLGIAVAGAPTVGALIGAFTNMALGEHDFAETFAQWWLGDALGVLLVASLILAWHSTPDRNRLTGLLGIPLVAFSIAGTALVMVLTDLPLMFVVLTGVVVAGAQFGVRAVTVTAIAVAATIAVTMLFESGSLLAGTSDGMGVIIIKLKLLVFSSGGLVVAAEVYERERMTEDATRLRAEAAAEHAIVNRLQRLLLPPEHISGKNYEAYGSYHAGTSALGVGGDWYEVADLPDGRVFITVGDVVGSGAPAAAVMARLRAVMLILAARADSAADLLTEVDQHIEQVIDALGTTVWAGLYDPRTQRLSYASAGHLPGFVLRGSDDVVRLDTQVGPPLGVTPHEVKPGGVVCIEGPATVFLYTDGLVERRGETIDAGIERLEQRLRLIGQAYAPEQLVVSLIPSDHDDDTVALAVALRPDLATSPWPELQRPSAR
jgi:integral membrane sensor domain MASE1